MNTSQHPESAEFAYEALSSQAPDSLQSPDLFSSETYEWEAIHNLDQFFIRVYRYYEEKGFSVILAARVLNVLALAFTVIFSGFLLLSVKWSALHSECVVAGTCDIAAVAIDYHPFAKGPTPWNVICVLYLAIFSVYWLYSLVHALRDIHAATDIRQFTTQKLGLSESQLKTVSWPEMAKRIVNVQNTTRLCMVRDLTEHDVVSRIMRKENYLIGMLNKGVLALHVGTPCFGLRKRFMLTKTLEWNLYWCLLDCMFGEDFRIKPGFLGDAKALQKRFRRMAICNLLVSPFVMLFLLIYFFMRNAEKFYHHPSSIGARRWSGLAYWRMREFNELPHYIRHRLDSSHKAAEKYLQQFPSPVLTQLGNFVSFIAGSFAALLLFMTLMDDFLLERDLFGRHVVWWAAVLGIILAVSRGLVQEPGVANDPELVLLEVVAHTHYLPRHWRSRAHTREVHSNFQALFPFKASLFVEEMASILLTPFVLYFSLPYCADAILEFVRDHTVFVEGVGDICSLANFDFERHGNSKYGANAHCPKAARSRQGKMEKSFLTFVSTYPTWEPGAAAKQMLATVDPCHPLAPSPHFPYTSLYNHPEPSGARGTMQHAMATASPNRLPHQAAAFSPSRARALGPNMASSMQGSIFGPAEMLHPQHEQPNSNLLHMSHLQPAEMLQPQHAQPGASMMHISQIQSAASQLVSEPAMQEPLGYKQLMLQSYYEDQKREQMQGPALHRLAQEQWQAQLADIPGSSQWQQQQHQHQAAAAHQVESDRSQETDDPVLVQHLRQSTMSASPGMMQRQEGLAPHATIGSLAQSVGPSGVYSRMGVGKAYSSPKPPLARRPPISSEMAFLGSSVDRSADATSSSDQQM